MRVNKCREPRDQYAGGCVNKRLSRDNKWNTAFKARYKRYEKHKIAGHTLCFGTKTSISGDREKATFNPTFSSHQVYAGVFDVCVNRQAIDKVEVKETSR